MQKHIIIFSHGFGTRSDDRGLFTDVAKGLPEVEPVLFDYNIVDETNRTLTASTLSKQAEMFSAMVEKVRSENPEAVIDVVAHSQGCIAVAMARFTGVRKIIFTAPSLASDIEHLINIFKDRPGTEINLESVSKLARNDGTVTLVPPEYWIERKNIAPVPLYNALSLTAKLNIIIATKDQVLSRGKTDGLNENTKIIILEGDHDFSKDTRIGLVAKIREILI